MKKLALLLPCIFYFVTLLQSQAPQSFTWQGVARDVNGIVTGTVNVRASIRQGSANGTAVYTETTTVATSAQGVFTLDIGKGNPLQFNTINWATGTYFLKIELDPNGGTNFTDLGATQILSVPFALHAQQSASALDDNDRNATNELQKLTKSGATITLDQNGGSVTLLDDDPNNEKQDLSFNPATKILSLSQSTQTANLSSLGGSSIWTEKNGFAEYTMNGAKLYKSGNADTLTMSPNLVQIINNTGNESMFLKKDTLQIRNQAGSLIDRAILTEKELSFISNIFSELIATTYGNSRITTVAQFPVFTIESNALVTTGDLGVGTDPNVPAARLDVNGDALINGLTLGRGKGNINTNSVFGLDALDKTNTATFLTAIGSNTVFSLLSGVDNTAIGADALNTLQSGNQNVAIGSLSGSTNPIGTAINTGTFVGFQASPNVAASNSSAFGNNARNTASNQIRLGNSSVNSIGGFVGFTNFSDGRYKKEVNNNVPGLDFILRLKPVTYKLDAHGMAGFLKEDIRRGKDGKLETSMPDNATLDSRNEISSKVMTGFIAQEVESSAREIGYDFSGIDAPKNEDSLYGLRYAEFVGPLVKAIQEQQELIKKLESRIEALEKEKK
ncbi:MAG: tail fiber domain-containing protein [Saprospiraceae bacterium]|nr:tail fiber domain-containing protein [Saprospiraceae bacterium]